MRAGGGAAQLNGAAGRNRRASVVDAKVTSAVPAAERQAVMRRK